MKKIEVKVKKNEEKVFPYVWVDGDDTEITFDVQLIGERAQATIVGIFLGTGNKTVTFNTNVRHIAPHTKSLTTIRGVFKNHSAFNNDGMVHIANGAKGADGYFASKILLFDDAKGRSVPSLEIDENDLKAGHASTVGRPDENQMFYLRSRGLSEKQAEQLLITGFYDPILHILPKSDQKDIKQKLLTSLRAE